jgi:Tfp pilus assembly protein PilX
MKGDSMVSPNAPCANQRGIALVMALLVLLVISLLAAVLMTTINVETKIAGHSTREAQALSVAEAGVAEAMERLRNGDVPNNNNPRMVAQIFNAAAGSVPVLGADSVAMSTQQPAGQWLAYSSASKADSVLTVEYKTDSLKTLIYKYDQSKNPAINVLTGYPIFQIKSTGRQGRAFRRIVAEVIQKPIVTNIKGAVTAGVDIKFTGNAVTCGFNHRGDTPAGTGDFGRTGALGSCNEDLAIDHWEYDTGHLTGIWTTGNINGGGAANTYGSPPQEWLQSGFYGGPWEPLGMSQAEYWSWLGAPKSIEPNPPKGIIYLDNNSTTQDASGSFAYHGSTGEGLLYVDGDLTLNAGTIYRGLIYVEGNLKLNGHAWILGALVVRGTTELANNGNATVLYSEEAIQQQISKYAGEFVTLSWREMPR